MRVALSPSLFGMFAMAALACGGNAPLTTSVVNRPGGASVGSGTAGGQGGAGGAPSTGQAGATSTGAAGATATGTAGATATGAAGAAGTTATGTAGTGGQSAPGITMCVPATLPGGECAVGAYMHAGVTSACECQDDVPCVCGDTCTNLLLDDDNCGVCGNRCGPTSTCNDGTCGPPSTVVVPARSGCTSIDLAVSGSTLYFTDLGHGSVQSIPVGGGPAVTYATGEAAPSHIAVVGSSVFWLDQGTTIRKGGANQAVTTLIGIAPVGGFVVSPDGATVYFSLGTMIYSIPAAGGVPVLVAREEMGGVPGGLALAGNTLAFPTGMNGDVDVATLVDGQVASCGKLAADGQSLIQVNCARFARSQGELFLDTILALPGEVIWFDGADLRSETAASMGTSSTLATTSDLGTGLAMNATTVYYSEGTPSVPGVGVVYKVPLATQQSVGVRIARGQDGPRSLAVSAAKVFWSTSDCSIESTNL